MSRSDLYGHYILYVHVFNYYCTTTAHRLKLILIKNKFLSAFKNEDAVLCVGVRFNVYDITGPLGSSNSKTELRMSTTEKSKSIKETISSVFGSQFLSGLCMFRVDLFPVVQKALKGNLNESRLNETRNLWRIEGMVSTASKSNQKKAAREIQFFSINGRPVEMPKLSRLLGEVWRNFELVDGSKKRPACILGIYLPNSMFDVNVSPDKREVLLTNDNEIYDLFQKQLHELWLSQTGGTFAANLVEKESNSGTKRPCPDTATNFESKKRPLEHPTNHANQVKEPIETQISNSPNIEPTGGNQRPHRRMKRRNAFVRSFDCVGTRTTDQYSGVASDTFRHSHDDVMTKSNVVSDGSNDHPKVEEVKNERISNARDDAMYLWKQTRLKFNSSQSERQLEDINKLKFLQSQNNGSASLNAATTTKNKSIDQTKDSNVDKTGTERPADDKTCSEDQKADAEVSGHHSASHSKNSGTTTKLDADEVSTNRSKQKSHYPPHQLNQLSNSISRSATKSGDDTRIIDNGSDAKDKVSSPRKNPYTSQNRRKLSDNTIEISSQLKSPPIVTPLDSTSTVESPSSTPSPQKVDDSNEEPVESIVWDAFRNTDHVVELAGAAHAQIINRRKKLKQVKVSRQDINNDDSEGTEQENLTSQKGDVVRLSKEDFLTMTIVGQFNHGFILALCQKGQLWILDQHACDEKYNFEKLCRETKIHEQKLIKPLPLELSPSEENCILSNMELFEQNGFRFHYDQTKPPRNRLSLTALPHSGGDDGRKAVQFGKEDVGALCAILGADGASSNAIAGSGIGADGGGSTKGNNAVRLHAGSGNGAIIRLPKSVAMFASRACRKSIMIGEPLSEKKMKEVVTRLRDVEQPWTCPHGRPTIRHIKDLLDDLIQDEKDSSKVVAGELAALSQEDLSQEDLLSQSHE